MSEQKVLSLANLHELDNGKAVAAVNHALKQIVQDIIDRPGDKAKRKMNLTVEMTPQLDKDTAALDTISTRFIIKASVPVRQTNEYPMLADTSGRLLFQPLTPFNPRQAGLPYVNPSTGEVQEEADGGDADEVQTL